MMLDTVIPRVCRQTLVDQGKVAPRYCGICGLGPCGGNSPAPAALAWPRAGDIVVSKPVGKRETFLGEVAEVHPGYFHVRDAGGGLWHRTRMELTPA
jgi:hypothetical protein